MHAFRSISALAGMLALAPSARTQEPEIRWEPYIGQAADGSALEGKLGRIRVPERHGAVDGPTIELAFVLYESDAPEPGPPIVFLAGGPGAPGVELCAEAATDPRLRLLDHGDVIGIDQRGTGLSMPNLEEGPDFSYELPLDRAATRDEVAAAHAEAVARCCAYWAEQGVDLAAYNTLESADDVDLVRRALGLALLRRHSAHVARAVLMKVEGPDDTWKLPSNVQRSLARLSELVAADPALNEHLPDFLGAVRGLLAQLAKEPVTITTDRFGEPLTIAIGPHDLQCVIASALGHTNTLVTLPAAVHMATQGEWRHLLGFVLASRRASVGSAMSLAMDCASGASPARRARIERERKDPANLLADAIDAPNWLAMCAACPDPELGDAFRAPFECDVPVLFVSGDLDARTPPENVEALLPGFSEHAHLLVRNTGHDPRELESPDYCARVHAFLRGAAVESTTIALPPLEFRPLQAR